MSGGITTGFDSNRGRYSQVPDQTTRKWFQHSSGMRISSTTVIATELKRQYPKLKLTITRQHHTDILGFAGAGHAQLSPVSDTSGDPDQRPYYDGEEDEDDYDDSYGDGLRADGFFGAPRAPRQYHSFPESVTLTRYVPPARRLDDSQVELLRRVTFAKYLLQWQETDFIVYLIEGADASDQHFVQSSYYILSNTSEAGESLVMAVGQWSNLLHEEIWVFDSGFWQKSRELFQSTMKASWDAVILSPNIKQSLIEDHLSFFRSRCTYQRLKVPWKRGIIYHGPPGNGKTISIKATMKMLYSLDPIIPTLYVRTLASFNGPEEAIKEIFSKARQVAPCYLVFEDLDSIVSDETRSYFLNEVDGINDNEGIFMIGSTNHLELLDPGISKRPSRFDRKYYFGNPNFKERVLYCQFWQSKLANNDDIQFPDKLYEAIAGITAEFSFAYIQEAFVAALLKIAREQPTVVPNASRRKEGKGLSREFAVQTKDPSEDWFRDARDFLEEGQDDDDLAHLVLWVEIKKQVKILRDALGDSEESGPRTD